VDTLFLLQPHGEDKTMHALKYSFFYFSSSVSHRVCDSWGISPQITFIMKGSGLEMCLVLFSVCHCPLMKAKRWTIPGPSQVEGYGICRLVYFTAHCKWGGHCHGVVKAGFILPPFSYLFFFCQTQRRLLLMLVNKWLCHCLFSPRETGILFVFMNLISLMFAKYSHNIWWVLYLF